MIQCKEASAEIQGSGAEGMRMQQYVNYNVDDRVVFNNNIENQLLNIEKLNLFFIYLFIITSLIIFLITLITFS